MASNPPQQDRSDRATIVVYAPEDAVWARWLEQVGVDAGLAVRLHRPGESDGEPDSDAPVVLVMSESFLRAARLAWPEWAGYRARPGLSAVIVGTAAVPAEAQDIPAIDLRLLPDEAQARSRVLELLGVADSVAAPSTLQQAGRMRVRYPRQRMFVEYQSASLPAHQPEWFYGRDEQLEQIRHWLDETGAAVLYGPPGVGKSWLAGAYVHRFRSQYDLIVWVRGDNGAVIRSELGELAGPLGLPDTLPHDTRYRDVVRALLGSDKRYLIVYDNVTPDSTRAADDALVLRRKPALLSEVVPWDGPGHVLFTSKVREWDNPHLISVPWFSSGEGADFLRHHIAELSDELGEQFSEAVGGSPVLLNALAHRGARGTDMIDEDLLAGVRETPFKTLADETTYKQAGLIVGDSLARLLDAPNGSDAAAAGQLLRLLTTFPPDQPISLALLTSRLPGTEHQRTRLPAELAEALSVDHRRRNVLALAARDSIAEACADPLAEGKRALKIHAVNWYGIRDFLPTEVAETNRHIAHRLLCDADLQQTELPALWGRYLWLWQQLEETGVLRCPRVADPHDPCSQLPVLIWNVIGALRVQGELTAAAALGLQAIEAWSELLGPEHLWLIRIRHMTGNVLWQMGRWERARDCAAAARAGVEPRRREFPKEYVGSCDLLAACMRMAGDWIGAVAVNRESQAWARECLGEDHIETVRASHNLAVAYRMAGDFPAAMDHDSANYQRFQDNSVSPDPILMLHCVNNIARDHRELGDYEASVTLQEWVLANFEDLFHDARQQNILRARKNLALSYRKSGRYAESLEMQHDALVDHVQVYGDDHPESIAARTNVANDYRVLGDLERALDHASEAYRRSAEALPGHPYTAACAVNYGAVLRDLGRHEEALRIDRVGVELFLGSLGADHPYTLAAQTGVASDLAATGLLAEAVELGTDTLDRSRRVRRRSHPYTLQCAINLALDLRAADRIAEADALERDSMDRYLATLGAEHPEVRAAGERVRGTCDIEPPPM